MIWMFERAGRQARLEVLYLAPDKYELRVVDGEGVEHLEQYTSADDAAKRQIEWQNALSAQGWEKTGGWKL